MYKIKSKMLILPMVISKFYKFIFPLPFNILSNSYNFNPLIFFSPFFWKFVFIIRPIFETWLKRSTRIWYSISNYKVFLRLRFRGKGYYLYLGKRFSLSFRFGFSHRVNRFPGAVWFKLLSKTEILMWSLFYLPMWIFAWSIKSIRPYNKYTGKGIRFSKQIIYKKLGKVGSYR